MVKGVTRRIVEIRDTGSCYFEKVIFFVRTDGCKDAGDDALTREARRIIDRYSKEAGMPDLNGKKHRFASFMFKFCLPAIAGSLMTIMLMKIF